MTQAATWPPSTTAPSLLFPSALCNFKLLCENSVDAAMVDETYSSTFGVVQWQRPGGGGEDQGGAGEEGGKPAFPTAWRSSRGIDDRVRRQGILVRRRPGDRRAAGGDPYDVVLRGRGDASRGDGAAPRPRFVDVRARGWFVTLLTNPDYDAVFEPPLDASFLDALCASPDPNVRLMTMNVAMSTATELAHAANGNADLAAGSALTKCRATSSSPSSLKKRKLIGCRGCARVAALLQAVSMDEAAFEADRGRAGKKGGAETAVDEWVAFCKKWGYGAAQRDAIRKQLEGLL